MYIDRHACTSIDMNAEGETCMHSYRQACSGMQMDRQPCMFEVIKACRETDRT